MVEERGSGGGLRRSWAVGTAKAADGAGAEAADACASMLATVSVSTSVSAAAAASTSTSHVSPRSLPSLHCTPVLIVLPVTLPAGLQRPKRSPKGSPALPGHPKLTKRRACSASEARRGAQSSSRWAASEGRNSARDCTPCSDCRVWNPQGADAGEGKGSTLLIGTGARTWRPGDCPGALTASRSLSRERCLA